MTEEELAEATKRSCCKCKTMFTPFSPFYFMCDQCKANMAVQRLDYHDAIEEIPRTWIRGNGND